MQKVAEEFYTQDLGSFESGDVLEQSAPFSGEFVVKVTGVHSVDVMYQFRLYGPSDGPDHIYHRENLAAKAFEHYSFRRRFRAERGANIKVAVIVGGVDVHGQVRTELLSSYQDPES